MKRISHFLTLLILIASVLTISCVSNKKMKAATAHVEKLKRDSIETHRKLAEKNALANKTTNKTKTDTTHDASVVIKKDIITSIPPLEVKHIFDSDYPSATEVNWTKETPLLKHENQDIRYYKVNFSLDKNKKSIIYSEKGNIIETRNQIMPDQLPPNIYSAIKKKYPDYSIVAASTFKNTKINGSYIVVISNTTYKDEKELILMENGAFVEQL